MTRHIMAAVALSLAAGTVHAAEPIEGNWKTASGETAQIVKCADSFCIIVKTGKFAGKQIGKLSGSQTDYSGEVTDPANDKTYSGSASVSGGSLQLKGCVMKVLCKSQTWTKL